MAYTKRFDGRKFDEIRAMDAKVGVIERATGSAMFKMGNTIAYAAVYGPRDLFPSFLQNSTRGIIRCYYDMWSFSVTDRKRPGPTRRSTEISKVSEAALFPALRLGAFPNTTFDIYINIIQADAGTRTAGINAAALALADAGVPMEDLVCSVAVGKVGDKICVDLDKEEEDFEEGATDLPVAIMPRSGKITLLQMDGNMTPKEIKEALTMAKKAMEKVKKVQVKALRDKYKGEDKK
jgi:exosome complex component RRP41